MAWSCCEVPGMALETALQSRGRQLYVLRSGVVSPAFPPHWLYYYLYLPDLGAGKARENMSNVNAFFLKGSHWVN